MPEIAIFVEKCGAQNENNKMIHCLDMIKEGGFFGKATLHLYIKIHTKNDFDPAFQSLMCCTGSKMSLLLRSDVKILVPARMLKLFKCSMKTSLAWNHYWMISTTDLILKFSTSPISSR